MRGHSSLWRVGERAAGDGDEEEEERRKGERAERVRERWRGGGRVVVEEVVVLVELDSEEREGLGAGMWGRGMLISV